MSEKQAFIPAASVVLARDGADGLEVLMVRRSEQLRNFRGLWVFPGGRIDAADHAAGDEVRQAAANAAVRETAEETGMAIDAAQLRQLSRWTAPEGAPKRFDTWFFVGVVERTQQVVVDGGEIKAHRWVAPAAVLAQQAAGQLKMMPPTFISLVEVGKHGDCAALRAAMDAHQPFHFTPLIRHVGDTLHFLYPGDAGFEAGDPAVEGPRHRCIMEGGDLLGGRPMRYVKEIEAAAPAGGSGSGAA